MRNEIVAAGSTLTAGELRAALQGVDDAAPVRLASVYGYAGDILSVEATDLSVVLEGEL